VAAKAGKFSKRAQESSLGKIVDDAVRGSSPKLISDLGYATDFIESPQGLNLKLYPAQRLIAKLTLGVPVNYKPMMIPVWDKLKENLRFTLSEPDFLKFLHDEGRCNVRDWRDCSPRGFGTVVLFAGRRSGKSQVVSALAGTCLRNLLSIEDPQSYYNVVPGSTLDFTLLGTDEDSSTRLYNKLKADINRSPFFAPYLHGVAGTTQMEFVSAADRLRREIKPSITVAAFPCTTRALRGPSSYFLAFDEFQHFKSSKDTNSDALYAAATPSTSQFPSKEDPEMADSRILVISSPLGRIGKMYELHMRGLADGIASDILTFRLSTAEMNPFLPAAKLREDRANNPDTFDAEFGGEFLDGKGSFVPVDKFDSCIDVGRPNIERFEVSTIGRKYFWGLDYGTKNDATALAIGHLEMNETKGVMFILDYIDRMMVGEAFGDGNPQGCCGVSAEAAARIATLSELELPTTVTWLVYMHQILPCFMGATDQHGGTTLKQLLQINGITTMGLIHLTDTINSKMYFILKGFITNGAASFPDVAKFKTEFKQLEAEFKSKYVMRVEAPSEKGAHDDMGDAVAIAALQAQKWLDEEGKLDLDPSGRSLQINPRILNPNLYVDPNSVTMRELQVMTRMSQMGDNLMLPPGLEIIKNPWGNRNPRRR